MRTLMTGIALTATMLMSGCAMPENHALHAYPPFGTAAGGGRIVVFHRSTTGNVLPASRSAAAKRSTPADTQVR
jgi:hypothetical protein